MMMAERFPNRVSIKAVDLWVDEAKSADILEVARRLQPSALSGICPTCGNMIYRAATLAKIESVSGGLAVARRKAE